MKVHRIEFELWLPRSLNEVFPFFADAANLELLTPPLLKFHVVTPLPVEMCVGALIDYRLRVHGMPVTWQSEITAWEPQRRFVDEQRRGPYRLWHHEHTFEAKDGGTLTRDIVDYAVPLDCIVHPLIVRPDLERVFRFRHQKLKELFGPDAGGHAT